MTAADGLFPFTVIGTASVDVIGVMFVVVLAVDFAGCFRTLARDMSPSFHRNGRVSQGEAVSITARLLNAWSQASEPCVRQPRTFSNAITDLIGAVVILLTTYLPTLTTASYFLTFEVLTW